MHSEEKKEPPQRLTAVLAARHRSKLNTKSQPPNKLKQVLGGCLVAFVLVGLVIIGLLAIAGACSPSSEETAAAARDCLKDINCASEKTRWQAYAEAYCVPRIEAFARYTHRWTDGFLEGKFDRVILQPSTGYTSLKYTGRKVEFQNGFGAWVKQAYTCHYDPINEKVLDVEVY